MMYVAQLQSASVMPESMRRVLVITSIDDCFECLFVIELHSLSLNIGKVKQNLTRAFSLGKLFYLM